MPSLSNAKCLSGTRYGEQMIGFSISRSATGPLLLLIVNTY
jgi:hypothetical protein